MVNKDLGRLIRYMMRAEAQAVAGGDGREAAIRVARDAYYTGEPAKLPSHTMQVTRMPS